LYSHSAGHTELLFGLWEGGFRLPRERLINAIGSDDARAFNACMYRIIHVKPQFVAAIGLCEEIEVEAYKMLQEGLERHYGFNWSIRASFPFITRLTRSMASAVIG
jgi:hypothetical protein